MNKHFLFALVILALGLNIIPTPSSGGPQNGSQMTCYYHNPLYLLNAIQYI